MYTLIKSCSRDYKEQLRRYLAHYCTAPESTDVEVYIKETIKFLVPKYFSMEELIKDALTIGSLIIPRELISLCMD